ncbi:MAG: RNA-protein complex protein Nop10 [Euryarchaeota archaeon]|nr:RNA-protein complex protein Nop10 [Euryarchaeota archaeon]
MKIRKCHGYTLQEKCPTCGETTTIARPPRFSPEDRYGEYRRRLKRELKAQSK